MFFSVGSRLGYIWQIDFSRFSSVSPSVFEEEDQICGSMLCAG